MPAPKESWAMKSRGHTKPWGEVYEWQTLSTVGGKAILIRERQRTSLKYHTIKNEVFFVLKGRVLVTHGNQFTVNDPEKYPMKQTVLVPGDVFTVLSECPYRLEALEDCQIIEIGDRSDDNPVILDDDYGRVGRVSRGEKNND
jgi:mannose-6-phosphate isomerase-like protein (cupin superfamily)